MSRAIAQKDFFTALLSGLLLGLAFSPFRYSYFIWICLIPLLLGTEKSFFHSFGMGLITGFVSNLFIYFWFWKTFHSAQISPLTTFLAWIVLSLVMGWYVAVFNGALFVVKSEVFKPWLGASVWVVLDHIKTHAITGFPWALVSQSQASHSCLIQIASVAGAEAITFLIVLINIQIAFLIKGLMEKNRSGEKGQLKGLMVSLFIVLTCWGWGTLRIPLKIPHSEKEIRVAVLQGNIDQYQKWDSAYEDGIQKTYERLAFDAGLGRPDVLIWPESSVPGWYPNEKKFVDWIKKIASKTKVHQIIGAVSSKAEGDYNSAFLVDPDGLIENNYDKIHLVPFGEYIPFGGFLKNFIPYLGKMGTFTPGKGFSLFEIKGVKFSPNICYEAIFPDLVRESVLIGGDIIVNITNDGWYLDTGAPYQHYAANILRAVENGRFLVRAANTGISAAIDPYGREIFRSPLNEQGIYFADLPVPDNPPQTLFLRWGHWFSIVCWGVCLFVYSGLCLAKLKSK